MSNTGKDLKLPPEFSGDAQLLLFTRYGDPRELGWENKWLMQWHIKTDFPWFPQEEICVNKHFKPILENALRRLETNSLHHEIKTFDGAFLIRGMGSNETVLSVHSWGAAIDLNAAHNPIGSNGKWSEAFIKTMEDADIYCGQSWSGRKDPKHFAMVNG